MTNGSSAYYRANLALVHHLGFGFHADLCAPGILKMLEPVRARRGLVVELGCGSGLLTRHLLDAGHQVIATDASEPMLDLARQHAAGAAFDIVKLPDDAIPTADAIVSIGHVLSYLPDAVALDRGLVAIANALRPGGVMAIDLCDRGWGDGRRDTPPQVRRGDGWLLVLESSVPSTDRFVRDITTFVRNPDGSWRRDDERHENVLIDTSRVPELLADHGVDARVGSSFGEEVLPAGLVTIVGHKR